MEGVMQQNLAVEKGIAVTRQNTEKHFAMMVDLMEKQGNSPADLRIINKVKTIYSATDNTIRLLDSINTEDRTIAIDNEIRIANEVLNFMTDYGHKIPK